jgi:fructuronate reductase
MVDRIVPATTDDALDASSTALGTRDEMALQTEPFKQWVIEDRFTAPRPKWEKVGAQIVKDVAAYEAMKLRLLNGSHSTIAYLGYLGGHKTVSDAMAVPEFKSFVRQLMDEEVSPTLDIPKGFDATKYKDDLLGRFSNSTLAHKTWQIAMDGSQKLPQRLLGTLYQNMKTGKSNAAAGLAVAGWMQYVGGVDEQGHAIDVSDPYADELAEVHKQADGDVGKIVDGFLAIEKIFGPMEDQPKGLDFVLIDALDQLCQDGAMQCIANYC